MVRKIDKMMALYEQIQLIDEMSKMGMLTKDEALAKIDEVRANMKKLRGGR